MEKDEMKIELRVPYVYSMTNHKHDSVVYGYT